MSGLFFTLLVSGAGIVAVLAHKVVELRRGSSLVSQSMREKGDALIRKAFVVRFSVLRDTVVGIGKNAWHHTVKFFHALALLTLHTLHDYILKLLNRLKGKGVRRQKGQASSFLQSVSEYKEMIHVPNGFHKKVEKENVNK